eukprot:GFUD01016253.1.p1 GENE.GFUD01016253.1~~GFUD01016253.1.p1  ORF type:complete len:220 (+),score=61.37 GFUD01016253.1:87-746(+)
MSNLFPPSAMPTPDLSHLTSSDYDQVYEPAEDSFLLLDALEQELPQLVSLNPTLAVEIGGGSGIISTALSLKLPHTYFIVTDVNKVACKAIQSTAVQNNTKLEVLNTTTLTHLSERLKSSVDILLCNPPYVATDNSEAGHEDISAAWAGGDLGMNVTKEVIDALDGVLSDSGVAYIVLEQCNKPHLVLDYIRHLQLNCEIIIERRAGREFLKVVKIFRR